MQEIFSDMRIESVESDVPSEPGVFVKAVKPVSFAERDLGDIRLYSMLRFGRSKNVGELDLTLYPVRSFVKGGLERISNSVHYRLGLGRKEH